MKIEAKFVCFVVVVAWQRRSIYPGRKKTTKHTKPNLRPHAFK
jgi:hypothetical protein